MKRIGRIAAWSVVGLFLLLLAGDGIAWLVDFRQTDQDLREEFAGQAIRPAVHYYQVANPDGGSKRTIRFIETPDSSSAKPVILFVHGAPSSLSFFNKFFKDSVLLRQAQLVSVDRPGYGYSDFGRVETSIINQAKCLQPLIDRYRNAPYLIVVGSSYGGSVSARLAMNNPNRVNQVVFISSALGPGLERTYSISYLANSPLIRWLVPPLLRLANDEKLAHKKALEALLPDWQRIKANITMLHGQRDDLVYPTNVQFAKKQLTHAPIKQFLLPESRHDIVVNKSEYICRILQGLLANYRHQTKPSLAFLEH